MSWFKHTPHNRAPLPPQKPQPQPQPSQEHWKKE